MENGVGKEGVNYMMIFRHTGIVSSWLNLKGGLIPRSRSAYLPLVDSLLSSPFYRLGAPIKEKHKAKNTKHTL